MQDRLDYATLTERAVSTTTTTIDYRWLLSERQRLSSARRPVPLATTPLIGQSQQVLGVVTSERFACLRLTQIAQVLLSAFVLDLDLGSLVSRRYPQAARAVDWSLTSVRRRSHRQSRVGLLYSGWLAAQCCLTPPLNQISK